MATSITTQADILTYTSVTDNELKRLSTERMEADNWQSCHDKAWSMIKGMLLVRNPPLEESDLGDSSEFASATCHAVIYIAYQESEMLSDEDRDRKRYWYSKMRKGFAMVNPTDPSGNYYGRESFGSRRGLRA